MSALKDRVSMYCAKKNIAISAFEKACGLSNGYFNQVSKRPSVEKLESISRAFVDLNLNWLLTGEGSMLRDTPTISGDFNTVGGNAINIGNVTNSVTGASSKQLNELKVENSHLKEMVAEKDKRIASLEQMLDYLTKK